MATTLSTLPLLNTGLACREAMRLADESNAYHSEGNRFYPDHGFLVFVDQFNVWVLLDEEYESSFVLPDYLGQASRGQALRYLHDCDRIFAKGVVEGRDSAKRALTKWLDIPGQEDIQD